VGDGGALIVVSRCDKRQVNLVVRETPASKDRRRGKRQVRDLGFGNVTSRQPVETQQTEKKTQCVLK
jgi:hypothetical protein